MELFCLLAVSIAVVLLQVNGHLHSDASKFQKYLECEHLLPSLVMAHYKQSSNPSGLAHNMLVTVAVHPLEKHTYVEFAEHFAEKVSLIWQDRKPH